MHQHEYDIKKHSYQMYQCNKMSTPLQRIIYLSN